MFPDAIESHLLGAAEIELNGFVPRGREIGIGPIPLIQYRSQVDRLIIQ